MSEEEMAKKTGNSGKGASKGISKVPLPSAVQDEIRKAARLKRRPQGGGGSDHGHLPLFDEIAADRARHAAEHNRVNCERALRHLLRLIDGKTWSALVKQAAQLYAAQLFNEQTVRWYCVEFLCVDPDEQPQPPVQLTDGLKDQIHRLFVERIMCARFEPRDTVGQRADWYNPLRVTVRQEQLARIAAR